MAKKKSKAVTKRTAAELKTVGDVSALDIAAQFAGAGSEAVTQDAMALPFIGILQALSDQVSKKSEKYVDGASPGMFCDSVRGNLWDGDEGILVIPCHFSRVWVEWVKRKHGGGLVKVHQSPPDPETIPDEHDVVDTHQHALLVLNPDGTWSQAIYPMKSTALTPSRQWNTRIADQQRTFLNPEHDEDDPNSKEEITKRNLPRWWSCWRIKTVEKENDQGRWFAPMAPELEIDLVDMEDAVGMIGMARDFQEICAAGEAQIDYRKMEDAIPADDEDPDAPSF
jgi:hypothetical protein